MYVCTMYVSERDVCEKEMESECRVSWADWLDCVRARSCVCVYVLYLTAV